MTTPTLREWLLHSDRYGRPSRLVAKREGGITHWSIISEPVNQRDEGERIHSLTTQQLREIAEIVGREPKYP